eukprot:scaffold6265_cov193-Cylindrotheca_fusiformis.AAC.15
MSTTTSLTPSFLEQEIRNIFSSPSFDLEKETQKSIRKQVTKRLQLDEFPSDQKALFKELVTRLVQEKEKEQNRASSLQDSDDENEDPVPSKKSLTKKKLVNKKSTNSSSKTKNNSPSSSTSDSPTKKKASSSSPSSYSSDVHKLISLGQAMRLGPRLHMGLKDMASNEERVEALTERLQEAGASWKGKIPTPHDISKAKAERQRQDDLDGLDTSLIVEEGRGRRRRGAVNYAVDIANDEEEEEEEAEEAAEPPRKKAKSPKSNEDNEEEDDDDDESDFEGDESESEAEFDEED